MTSRSSELGTRPAVAAGSPSPRPATTARSARRLWFSAYVSLVCLPLVVAALSDPLAAPRPILADIGVAFGLLGLALLLVQFALVSRLRPVSRPFGSDALMQWHRGMGIAALVFVIVHPLLAPEVTWRAWNPFGGPAGPQAGAIAFWATAAIVVSSMWRRRLRLGYEVWRAAHLLLALLVAAAAFWHALAMGPYSSAPAVRWTLAGYAGLFAALLVRYRVVRPALLLRRPWEVVANEDIGGSTRLLRVRPSGHGGLRFEPGQFAWILTGASPVVADEHPLSIASSAEPNPEGGVEFAIKALGDWSGRTVPSLAPGRRVWVDGPFGGFTPSASDRGLVLVAGGIGIAPMRSILLTLRDRGDRRGVWLFYAASDWSRVVFRDEIERLERELDLSVCFVFEKPDAAWNGERGFITRDILARHLPGDLVELEYFVCGPVPMMDAIEPTLASLGVPSARVHTERFQVV